MKKQLSILAGVVMPIGLLAACSGSGQPLQPPEAIAGTLWVGGGASGSHTGGYGYGGTSACYDDDGCAVAGTYAAGGSFPADGGYGSQDPGGDGGTGVHYGGYSTGGSSPADGGYSSGGAWAGAGGYWTGDSGAGGYWMGDGGTTYGGTSSGYGGTSSGGYDPTCLQNVAHCFEAAANCYQYSPWSDCDQIVDVCDAIQQDCE